MTTASTPLVGSDSTSSGFNPSTQQPAITFGVWGDSGNADGVIGSTATGIGVFGQSTTGTAVQGSSDNGIGVEAASAGGTALHAAFGPEGAAVTEAFLATSSLAADFQGDVATTGNIAVGLSAGEQAQRPVHVEGSGPSTPGSAGAEVHSGGSGGGFSFADRTAGTPAGSFVANPTNGERWVWYAENGTARLWSGADVMSASATGVSIDGALTAAQRMQVQQGPQDPSAGIWFFQSAPKNNQGFVGMSDDTVRRHTHRALRQHRSGLGAHHGHRQWRGQHSARNQHPESHSSESHGVQQRPCQQHYQHCGLRYEYERHRCMGRRQDGRERHRPVAIYGQCDRVWDHHRPCKELSDRPSLRPGEPNAYPRVRRIRRTIQRLLRQYRAR